MLTKYDRLGASSRLRSLQFISSLQNAGIEIKTQSFISDEMLLQKYVHKKYRFKAIFDAYANRVRQLAKRRDFDLVWIEKEALPWLPGSWERILLRGVPYALDYDDAIFHNYDLHSSKWVRYLLGRRIDRLMAGARMVGVGNDYLAQRAKNAGARWVEILPTVVDLKRYVIQPRSQEQAKIPQLVWIGSPSTVKYLAAIEASLADLAQRITFKLRVIGGALEMTGVDVECVPWSEETEVEAIGQCDIGIMPLSESPWERGKCGYKLIQYMACGLPVVASPVGINTKIVRDGVNGFLAESASMWVSKLEQLLRDPQLRQSMGQMGRKDVETEYSVELAAPRLAGLLLKAMSRPACLN
jgi:glycosyltransferase involved in cell wall biosynthesis